MMLNLARVIKPWKEADALSAHINLYGFWTETTFLTKSGDLGMVLSVAGVDYESLDNDEQQYAVKRMESALKAFGEGFHVYQYLFKTNRPDIPFARYDDELIDAAIDQRRQFFESKRDRLYEIEIFYVIVLEGVRSKTGILSALARMPRDPQGGFGELKAQFTSDNMKTLLRSHIDADLVRLEQRVQNFTRQLADLMPIEVQGQQAQFRFFRRLLNFDEWRIDGRPQSTQYLDFQVVNSNIEAERDHLRVGDHFVRILTMKESIAETRPLVLDRLLKIEGNFYVVTEWTPLSMAKARKEVDKRRRHFNMSKSGFVSQMSSDPAKTNQRDVLIDESKQADIENLACGLSATARASVISRSRLFSTAATYRLSIRRWANLPVSLPMQTARSSLKRTTSSMRSLPPFPATTPRTFARCTCSIPTMPTCLFSSPSTQARKRIRIFARSIWQFSKQTTPRRTI